MVSVIIAFLSARSRPDGGSPRGASFLFPLSSLEFALDGIADELGHFLLADQRLNPFQRFFRKPDDGRFYV